MEFLLRSPIVLLLFVCWTAPAVAKPDAEGSSDHPLITRYPGFFIRDYTAIEFDRAEVITGAIYQDESRKYKLPVQTVEGAVTNTIYQYSNSDISTFAIISNYKKAFKKLGAEITFFCEGEEECVKSGAFYSNAINNRANFLKGIFARVPNDLAIISGVVSGSGKRSHFMILAGVDNLNNLSFVNQSIVVEESLDDNKLSIGSLEDLTNPLKKTGSVVLEGVQFDFDTADLKVSSDPVIDILRDFLESEPETQVFIVGHTDNVGDYEYNLNLSKQRATSVVAALVARGIAASRLTPLGIGPVSPVASNDTKDGQAKNRRVEMVKK